MVKSFNARFIEVFRSLEDFKKEVENAGILSEQTSDLDTLYSTSVEAIKGFIRTIVGECPDIVYDGSIVPSLTYKTAAVGFLLYEYNSHELISEIYECMSECKFESIDYALSLEDSEMNIEIFPDAVTESPNYTYNSTKDYITVNLNTSVEKEDIGLIIEKAKIILESMRNSKEITLNAEIVDINLDFKSTGNLILTEIDLFSDGYTSDTATKVYLGNLRPVLSVKDKKFELNPNLIAVLE